MMIKYQYKTKPFDHQRIVLNKCWDKPTFALFMEQGTGKSKVIIDNAAFLYEQGRIDGVLIIAPNGPHVDWLTDEFHKHCPTRIPLRKLAWSTGHSHSKAWANEWDDFLQTSQSRLLVFTMNWQAINTPKGFAAAGAFLKNGKVLMVVDESSCIATPSAKITKRTINLGKHAVYRRILNGTPASEGPLKYYSQFKFLNIDILGYHSFFAFKTTFAVWEQRVFGQGSRPIQVQARDVDNKLVFQNLPLLRSLIEPFSYRITKDKCFDLPPKVYQKRRFILPSAQRKIYDKLRDELVMEMDGQEFPVTMKMVRMMRLQQIASGFIKVDVDLPPVKLENNARLKALDELLEEIPDSAKVIIWARFTMDVDIIMEHLGAAAVRYDGQVKTKDRTINKNLFNDPDSRVRFFVAKQKAAGKALTLNGASYAIYYSNDFPLEWRQQSEDRFHRYGQEGNEEGNVVIIDLIADDTVDDVIVQALRTKREIADLITGDNPREWL